MLEQLGGEGEFVNHSRWDGDRGVQLKEFLRPVTTIAVIDARNLSVREDRYSCGSPESINEAFSLSGNGYSC